MRETNKLLRSKYAVALTLILLAEGVLYYTAYGLEKTPANQPLEQFATNLGGWQMAAQGQIEKEVQDVLRADDMVTRIYVNPSMNASASLFVAYFRTQRTGQAPHSPKNCLPGSGWSPLEDGRIDVPIEGERTPININRYVVARGENASVVLYWYQSRKRVIASEYTAKIWLVLDSIRLHRSDTALVRVVVPVVNRDNDSATKIGVAFVQSMFPVLQAYLPS